jgi:predicted membrane-bound spermidine synthase
VPYVVLVKVFGAWGARLAAAAAVPPGVIPEHGAPEDDEEIPKTRV